MAVVPALLAALEALEVQEGATLLVWNLIGQILAAGLAPELAALQEKAWSINNSAALTPAEAATAAVKGHMSNADAATEAALSGLNGERFAILQAAAQNPPDWQFLMQALRRGFINARGVGAAETSVEQGVRESFLGNKWLDLLFKMQYQLPGAGTITEARLRGYISPADFDKRMEQEGFDADARHLIFVAAGVPISPQEGYAAFHRGLIPKDDPNPDTPSLAQVFRESRINDKYLDVWMALQRYIPPPRTITALLRAGSITEARARELFKFAGLDEVDIDSYVNDASHQKTQAVKDLAVNTVLGMFAAGEITRQQAHDFVALHHYSEADIGFLLDYEEFKLVEAQVKALVSRIRTYYVGHKISKQTAADALSNVGMAAEVVNRYLAIWDQEAHASPVLLTATQLATAAGQKRIDALAAFEEIQGRGYDARDAYLLLAEHKADMSDVPKPAGVL